MATAAPPSSPERHGNAVRFSRWNGGEYGTLDSGLATEGKLLQHRFDAFYNYAKVQYFAGNNVCVYTSGLIGPRPGLKQITITSMVTGTVQGMDSTLSGSGTGPWFWVAIGGNFYQVDAGAGTVSAAYTGGGVPLTLTAPIPNGGSYGTGTILNLKDVGLYYLTHGATKTLTAISSPPLGNCIGYYGQRFVINDSDAGGGSGDSRMLYSDPFPGWGTFGANSYYDIGSALGITMLRPFRDGLMIGKENGEVWNLTGVLGASATVRQLSRSGAPWTEPRGLMLDCNEMFYMGYKKPYPSSFNGALHADFKNMQFTGGVNAADSGVTPGFRFLPMSWVTTKDFVILSGQSGAGAANRMLMSLNDVMSFHTFGVTIDPWGVDMSQNAATSTGSSTNALILASGAAGKYYWFKSDLDRPGFSGDSYSQPGDGSTTPLDASFSTPEWWDEQGHEFRVVEVIVDYRGWRTGSATNNRIDVRVDALHRIGDVATTAGTTLTVVNAAGTTYSTTGDDRRVVCTMGDQGYGSGFTVNIPVLRGCAIRSITAVMEQRGGRRA